MPNYTRRALFAILIVQQLVLFIHERDVPVHSSHSRTRSLSRSESDSKANQSVKGVFIQNIPQITCSVASHTRRLLARGLVNLWRDETVHSAVTGGITWTRNMSHGLREREIWVNGFQKERFVPERNITRDNSDEENQQWCSSSETRFLQSKSLEQLYKTQFWLDACLKLKRWSLCVRPTTSGRNH